MLKQRLITAVILLIIVCSILFLTSSLVFQVAAGLVLLAASWEWGRLLAKKNCTYIRVLLLLLVALVYLEVLLFVPSVWALSAGGVMTIWGLAAVIAYDHQKQPLGFQYSLLRVLACLALIVPTMLSLFLLRVGPHGQGMVFYVLGLVFINDTAAYFGGRFFGKHALAPLVSPKKTWEGCFIGFIAGLIWAGLFPLVIWPEDYNAFSLLLVAIPSLIAAVIGDLFISVFKRQIHIKDTGNLLPGHGGLLDRIDAVLMGIPVFTLVALWMGLL
jgi:phosphatidate cytidylyltransferase